ncbi:hypothetical protein TNCT_312261 [Trichonephila clavata]|uniref:Uncharacterized protein n=1 Tax=Trichonephila clavata TaxID=2740835 RepID=A0A8X6LWY5_TRICU|nr:hypothetical protein TNCT_312261 [Trichonephila clavata]
MPMRKRGSLSNKSVKSKAVQHTRAAEASNEKRARLYEDQLRHRFSRAAETPEQRQSRLQEDQVYDSVSRAVKTPIQHVARLLG